MITVNKSVNLEMDKIKQLIINLDSKEFDGHTEFHMLSMEEKLIWIMQISLFFFEIYNRYFIDNKFY